MSTWLAMLRVCRWRALGTVNQLATASATLKRCAVQRPVLFAIAVAVVWSAVVLPVRCTWVAEVTGVLVPLTVIFACRWWHETGVASGKPTIRWLLLIPLLSAMLAVRDPVQHLRFDLPLAAGLELLCHGVVQYLVRGLGQWRGTGCVVLVTSPIVVAALPHDPLGGLAVLVVLSAARWHVGSVWPLFLVRLTVPDSLPSWLGVALVGYALVLLWMAPTVAMENRPTVRVLCFDLRGRIILLGWHDPFDGSRAWDLPGGGIDNGEPPLETARRELREETGLPKSCVLDTYVVGHRDAYWNGVRYRGVERFYLAMLLDDDLDKDGVAGPDAREPHEVAFVREQRWALPDEAFGLPGHVQLSALARIADAALAAANARRAGLD